MESLFKIFSQYGWEGLFGIIICVGIYFIGIYISKKLSKNVSSGLEKVGEKLSDKISEQNDKLVDTIVNQQDKLLTSILNSKNIEEENHNYMLNERIELSEDINNSLRDIMNIHNAQRAFVIEFHNSYKNLSGVPFAKFSCTFEWFDKGLSSLSSKIMSLPFSQMAKITSDVIKTKDQMKVYTDMVKMEEENPALFAELKDTRTKAVVYSAMYDRNNLLMGFLILEYQIPLEEAHLNLSQLKIQTAEVTSLLNIRYKFINNNTKKES